MLTSAIASLLITVLGVAAGAAHPDHEPPRVVGGVVRTFVNGTLQLDTFDPASMQRKTISAVVHEKTKWLMGKQRVEPFVLTPGQRLEVIVVLEDLLDGSMQLRVAQVKAPAPKNKKR